MNTGELQNYDPCNGCLLKNSCSEMCPNVIDYYKPRLETRKGEWDYTNDYKYLSFKETQPPNPFINFIPENKKFIKSIFLSYILIILLFVIIINLH